MSANNDSPEAVIIISARWFVGPAVALALVLVAWGSHGSLPGWLLPLEVSLGVVSLFALGSFRYQFHKNVLTFGWLPVELVTWAVHQWQREGAHGALTTWVAAGWARIPWTWRFLDHLIHADTLLFIAALSFFVSAIAQTRALESIALRLIRRQKGEVFRIVLALCAVVAVLSGLLDGVSMVGLLIRTVSIVMLAAGSSMVSLRRVVLLSTVVTTVCGMWLAYGEPPNLIMKANVLDTTGRALLDDRFFLQWCAPAALLSFGVVAWELRRAIGGVRVDPSSLDLMERNAATLRFTQSVRFGRVLTEIELAEDHWATLGEHAPQVLRALHGGSSLGDALVAQGVPRDVRLRLLGEYAGPEHAEVVDDHFTARATGDADAADAHAHVFYKRIYTPAMARVRSRKFALVGLLIFMALLLVHGTTHAVPLFVPPTVGFLISFYGLRPHPNVRRLALRDGAHEVAEYVFLVPLFVAVSLLAASGFFDRLREPFAASITSLGPLAIALQQLVGATVLSAVLDNNVVADFASRLLTNLPRAVLSLFAVAQIGGYALGGCWTHVGSAQSVIAFAFVKRDIDPICSPVGWLREMTGPVLRIFVVLAAYLAAVWLVAR